MSEYGIGRIPGDVDPYSETQALLNDMISQEVEARRASRKTKRCARCGIGIEPMALMSSSSGALCPDCYDDTDGEG